jgi:hypothetical protein
VFGKTHLRDLSVVLSSVMDDGRRLMKWLSLLKNVSNGKHSNCEKVNRRMKERVTYKSDLGVNYFDEIRFRPS